MCERRDYRPELSGEEYKFSIQPTIIPLYTVFPAFKESIVISYLKNIR